MNSLKVYLHYKMNKNVIFGLNQKYNIIYFTGAEKQFYYLTALLPRHRTMIEE